MIRSDMFELWLIIVGLVAWCFFQWPYRRYRLDLYRQRLFVIRDELFDEAAKGTLPFDSLAYRGTRDLLNRYIRYGHRYSLLYWLLVLKSGKGLLTPEVAQRVEQFIGQINALDKPAQTAITQALAKAHWELIRCAVHRSALFPLWLCIAGAMRISKRLSSLLEWPEILWRTAAAAYG